MEKVIQFVMMSEYSLILRLAECLSLVHEGRWLQMLLAGCTNVHLIWLLIQLAEDVIGRLMLSAHRIVCDDKKFNMSKNSYHKSLIAQMLSYIYHWLSFSLLLCRYSEFSIWYWSNFSIRWTILNTWRNVKSKSVS